MPNAPQVTVQTIPALRVLAIRRPIAGHAEAAALLSKLREAAGDAAQGPGICVTFRRTPEGRIDAQMAIPVDEAVVAPDLPGVEGASLSTLPADIFLHIEHNGPYVADGDQDGIPETIGRLGQFAREHCLLIGDNPSRYVYREGCETHGNQVSAYRTDVLVSYHLPIWLRALRDGVAAHSGEAMADAVMEGSEDLQEGFDADRVRHWVQAALEKVDGAIEDKRARACLMNGCAHRHPQGPLDRWRSAYEDSGSLDAFIDRLIEDKDLYPPRSWRGTGEQAHVFFVERIIPYREAYNRASDPKEKRFHACFCSMMKPAILHEETVSSTFCDCSGGWFVQIWEAILGQTLRVDVVNSVLQGDERCVFAIHLPVEEV